MTVRRWGLAVWLAPALVLALVATVLFVRRDVGGAGGATAAKVPSATSGTVHYDRSSKQLDFMLPTFTDGSLSTEQLRGRPAVLNFFASWCGPCVVELPAFEAVHRAAGDRVAFVGVNPQSRDSAPAAAQLLRETGISFPAVQDRGDELLRAFSPIGAMPVTVFLDGGGRVADVHLGPLTEPALRARIFRALDVTV